MSTIIIQGLNSTKLIIQGFSSAGVSSSHHVILQGLKSQFFITQGYGVSAVIPDVSVVGHASALVRIRKAIAGVVIR